jgi:glyoxylase-like metal-dependent hydrolase (beta-lactamase superfamily II)
MEVAELIEGEQGRARIPIPAFVIEHAGSVLVFDAGLHPSLGDHRSERFRELAPDIECFLPAGANLRDRLESCGIDSADVRMLALSHLHFDHGGGSCLVANADLLIQRLEWQAAVADVNGEIYMPGDIDAGRELRLLDGECDVFGDGRVVLLPTTGHTAGHQSLRLRTDNGGELVLCGDACYFERSLRMLTPPPHAFSRDSQLEGFERLRRMELGGARLIFGHESRQWPIGPDDDRVIELSDV